MFLFGYFPWINYAVALENSFSTHSQNGLSFSKRAIVIFLRSYFLSSKAHRVSQRTHRTFLVSYDVQYIENVSN